MNKNINKSALVILFTSLFLSACTFTMSTDDVSSVTPTPQASSPTTLPSPSLIPTSSLPAGWQTYTNQDFGFEISFPSGYQALTDSNNLYGWPNGVVLIYNGGQSYDLAIEHWNSPSEYGQKYPNQPNLTVKNIGNVYITLLNTNTDPQVDQIIQTFKTLQTP